MLNHGTSSRQNRFEPLFSCFAEPHDPFLLRVRQLQQRTGTAGDGRVPRVHRETNPSLPDLHYQPGQTQPNPVNPSQTIQSQSIPVYSRLFWIILGLFWDYGIVGIGVRDVGIGGSGRDRVCRDRVISCHFLTSSAPSSSLARSSAPPCSTRLYPITTLS